MAASAADPGARTRSRASRSERDRIGRLPRPRDMEMALDGCAGTGGTAGDARFRIVGTLHLLSSAVRRHRLGIHSLASHFATVEMGRNQTRSTGEDPRWPLVPARIERGGGRIRAGGSPAGSSLRRRARALHDWLLAAIDEPAIHSAAGDTCTDLSRPA